MSFIIILRLVIVWYVSGFVVDDDEDDTEKIKFTKEEKHIFFS